MSDVITEAGAAPEAPGLPPTPEPHPLLESLRPLLGTWRLEVGVGAPETGGILRREMMPGGYYLVEHVDSGSTGGMQFVGYDPADGALKGTYYSSDGPGPFGRIALEYVWEVDGADVTIWMGEVGSPARYTGTFDADRTVLRGSWAWPGGGYDSVETRIE